MSYHAEKLVIDGHTDTHTHAGNNNTLRPKLASGKNDFGIKLVFTLLLIPVNSTMLPMQCFSSCARVMVVPPFDHPWRHQRSRESRDHHYDAQLIYWIQKF